MNQLETALLRSLDHQQHGHPADQPELTAAQFDAIALALREKGLVGIQTETLRNDWMGASRTVVNAVWLTWEGRQAVDAL